MQGVFYKGAHEEQCLPAALTTAWHSGAMKDSCPLAGRRPGGQCKCQRTQRSVTPDPQHSCHFVLHRQNGVLVLHWGSLQNLLP